MRLYDPYRQKMVEFMEIQLRQRGYYVMLRTYKTSQDVMNLLYNWSMDGAISFCQPFSKEEVKLAS